MTDFQTPKFICEHMTLMVPMGAKTILEPTPGEGNLVSTLEDNGFQVTAPADFFKLEITHLGASPGSWRILSL